MNYIKISDISKQGHMDYKGLNIDLFTPYKTIYFKEGYGQSCITQTSEDLSDFANDDIEIITKEEYISILNNLDSIEVENFKSNVSEVASALDTKVIYIVDKNKDLGEEAIIDLHIRTSESVDNLSEINELTQKALLDLHARVLTALDEMDRKLKQLDIQ